MCVYLLHIEPPYRHAAHYTGYAQDGDPARRLEEHKRGRGSPLVYAAVGAGCEVSVVRTWQGGRVLERRLKKRKNAPCLCPRCNPVSAFHNAVFAEVGAPST